MTIEVAVKTGSAVVFAADSKVTTSAIGGYQENGDLLWAEQTYDNGVKLVHDRTARVMAMVAGHANVGRLPATDVISRMSLGGGSALTVEQQDAEINHLVGSIAEQKKAYWETLEVEPANWRGPTILLATSAVDGITPRVWRADLHGPAYTLKEILTAPGIETEGSYDEVFTLLYGFDGGALESICVNLGVSIDQWAEAFKKAKVLRPIDKLNLWSMPVQDAIDLAVFLATVQVEMDKFLPGTPACGGAIDVMVLQMAPEPVIKTYPGKALHHPHLSGTVVVMKRSSDALRYLQDQMPARRELIESGRVRVTPPVEIRRRLAKLLSEGFPQSLPPAPMGDLEGNETMTIGGCRGHVCSVCGDPIQDDAALSVEYLYSTGTYHFHGQCNDLWLEERQRPVKRTKSL